jgi:deoxyribodipyrimidine photo-lyase
VVAASQPQRARRAAPREGIRADPASRCGRRRPAALVEETGAGAVYWNRRYGGAERAVDAGSRSRCARAASRCRRSRHPCCSSRGRCGREPARPTGSSRRSGRRRRQPAAAPAAARAARAARAGTAPGIRRPRRVGTAADDARLGGGPARTMAARRGRREGRLREFLRDDADDYDRARDEPAGGPPLCCRRGCAGVSSALRGLARGGGVRCARGRLLSELGWREFAWHTSSTSPTSRRRISGRPSTRSPGRACARSSARVAARRDGHPLVDAGMRELWGPGSCTTGCGW